MRLIHLCPGFIYLICDLAIFFLGSLAVPRGSDTTKSWEKGRELVHEGQKFRRRAFSISAFGFPSIFFTLLIIEHLAFVSILYYPIRNYQGNFL
jgi:hypothetical protein